MSTKVPTDKGLIKKLPERGLGRGLSSLLGDQGVEAATKVGVKTGLAEKPDLVSVVLREIPVEWINIGPWQPRRIFDKASLEELAASIKQKGIVQPLLLRPNPENNTRFQLVAGERRWRAAQLAKTHEVPAIIRNMTDAECYEIALIENIQRSDLSVIEEAQGYQKLLELNHYTQEQLSKIIGKSRSHITNIMRLLLLPNSVQVLLINQQITMGQARPLIGHKQAETLSKIIVNKNLSARQAEALAKKAGDANKKLKTQSSDIGALEKRVTEHLGLVCNINWNDSRERGKLTINLLSLDQMTDLLSKLGIR